MAENSKSTEADVNIEPIVLDDLDNTRFLEWYDEPHPGELCQQCHQGFLDYDGLLNLVCQNCGISFAGCST